MKVLLEGLRTDELRDGDIILACKTKGYPYGLGWTEWVKGATDRYVVGSDTQRSLPHLLAFYKPDPGRFLWRIYRDASFAEPPHPLNYGFYVPPTKKLKEWPHDCPRCKNRECAIQLATTWDCRNGCWK